MTPGPSFTLPTSPNPAVARSEADASISNSTLDQRSSVYASASTQSGTDINSSHVASDNSDQLLSIDASSRRLEAAIAQPKHCARCGQLLDALPPSQDRHPGLPRTPSSASMSAPSPSSYAFAPDSIRSQHRLQPHQTLTSAINAAAAAALSRHLGTDESVPTDADGHAICMQCSAQLAHVNITTNTVPSALSTTTHASASSDSHLVPASRSAHTTDIQQPLTSTHSTSHHDVQNTSNSTQASSAVQANPNFSPDASSPATPIIPQPNAPETHLTISVDNMGAGGDAAPTQSVEDVHMHDPSAFPPLERAPLSPALRAPSSPPSIARSSSRGRIRFADSEPQHNTGAAESASSMYGLGRSGSFSRSLSFGPESVSSSLPTASVVVSLPPSYTPTPILESTPLLGSMQTTHNASRSASLSTHPLPQITSRSSGSQHQASTSSPGSTSHTPHVPAPAHAIPGGVKQRRPSSARRLSRSGSCTGPTTMPFAVVGTNAAKDDDPYGPGAVTRPRLGLLSTHVIADELYNAARVTRPPALISCSTSTSLAASSAQHATGIDPTRAVRYHVDLLSYSYPDPAFTRGSESGKARQDEVMEVDMDDEKIALGLAAKQSNPGFFDPARPDPLVELSLLRAPPKTRGCLYPGATFNGTQKSGRNSYDVTVRIVNVDLEASHLCGYLNIRGLTEDWPELTTYFDAEIIGDRYGFVTEKWGATEADDLKHWARFPPFRPLRSGLSKPGLRFNHLNKGFVFMRWKEKFLVPDHRVRDINGASFAGFYYVCVELGESASAGANARASARVGRKSFSSSSSGGAARGRSASNVSMASGNSTGVGGGGGYRMGSNEGDSPILSHSSSTATTSTAAGNAPTAATAVSGAQWYAARTQRRRELSLSSPSTNIALADSQRSNYNNNTSNATYYHPIYHPRSPHGLPPSGPVFWPTSPTSPNLGTTTTGTAGTGSTMASASAGGGGDVGVERMEAFENMWKESVVEEDVMSYESDEEGEGEDDDFGAVGKMSGFYFHENSEPYQQLSLSHTPQATSCAFEMR
ncbi:uncharacterized protein MEPE_00227 [Melanopsichium pennsylvanicum]|uniref:VID24-required for vacuolar import and degradation of Fbp1p n=2 Tax=Melanopsichium pennsylvanicum TaxID=63383 RepID=A0AAJ4XG78_9BASI|nr:conserved hypothetical protein [Melanopsichium pennsylvanicum 4]SNX81522.1 uncharacterized protein MEPE_00227 [Melanopsichium pennsylvanicum]